MNRLSRILVAVNGSEGSNKTFKASVELAMLTQFDIITMVAGAIAIATGMAGYAAIGKFRTIKYRLNDRE